MSYLMQKQKFLCQRRKIDWYGENAGQHREQWIYKDIYEIHGTEKTEAVAVQINDRYYIAKRQ